MPKKIRNLWAIIVGLTLLASIGLQLVTAWAHIANDTTSEENEEYAIYTKYILYGVTGLFVAVFLALLLFFATKISHVVQNRSTSKSEKKD
jgi:uncharacterized membrane protein